MSNNKLQPKVSIIIPVFNGAAYLVEAVNSCLNQTYKNIELVVVNDGSTDSTDTLMKFLVKKDSRIKYFTKENTGLADTENYGIERATGEIIARADADDIQDHNKIQILVEALEKSDFAYTGYFHGNIYGQPWQEVHPGAFTLDNIRNNTCASGCSFAYWKDRIPVKYRPELRVNEDKAFLFDLFRYKKEHGLNYALVYIPTFNYRMLPTGMSYSRKKLVKKIDKLICKEIDDYEKS